MSLTDDTPITDLDSVDLGDDTRVRARDNAVLRMSEADAAVTDDAGDPIDGGPNADAGDGGNPLEDPLSDFCSGSGTVVVVRSGGVRAVVDSTADAPPQP